MDLSGVIDDGSVSGNGKNNDGVNDGSLSVNGKNNVFHCSNVMLKV